MASTLKVDTIQTNDGSGTIALQNQLSGMTTASLPTVTTDKLGTGAVLQVVQTTNTGDVSTSSTSYSDKMSASITPSSTSSKILIRGMVPCRAAHNTTNNADHSGHIRIVDGSNNVIVQTGKYITWAYAASTSTPWSQQTHYFEYLHSPSTTSAITYKVQVAASNASNLMYFGHDTNLSSITLMEIAG